MMLSISLREMDCSDRKLLNVQQLAIEMDNFNITHRRLTVMLAI
jgi:hypothetical protein